MIFSINFSPAILTIHCLFVVDPALLVIKSTPFVLCDSGRLWRCVRIVDAGLHQHSEDRTLPSRRHRSQLLRCESPEQLEFIAVEAGLCRMFLKEVEWWQADEEAEGELEEGAGMDPVEGEFEGVESGNGVIQVGRGRGSCPEGEASLPMFLVAADILYTFQSRVIFCWNVPSPPPTTLTRQHDQLEPGLDTTQPALI